MISPEEIQDRGATFFFEDGSDSVYIDSVVQQVVFDRYENVEVDSLATQEMGGTTHLSFFRSSGQKDQKSVLDPKITQDEIDARISTLFHLLNES